MGKKKRPIYLFFCINSSLIIILLQDNAWPHVARMTLQKFTNLRYETFPHTHFFLIDHSPTHFFLGIQTLFYAKNIPFQRRTRNCINWFLGIKTIRVFCIGINKIVNWWQKCIVVQGSYFDWLKHCLNSLIQG